MLYSDSTGISFSLHDFSFLSSMVSKWVFLELFLELGVLSFSPPFSFLKTRAGIHSRVGAYKYLVSLFFFY